MKKVLIPLFIFVIILFAGVVLAKDVLIKTAFEKGVTGLTGFPTKIGSIGIQLPGIVHLKGLKISNPKGFKNEIFADIPEIYVSLDPGAVLRKEKILLHEVRLNLGELNIEKNGQGVSNVSLLSSLGKSSGGQKPKTETKAPGKSLPFLLERLELTIRRVHYQDSSSLVPQNVSVDMNVEKQVFTNIQDPNFLVSLILMKIVYGTTFGNLIGVSPEFLQNTLKDFTATGGQIFNQTRGLVTNEVGKVLNSELVPDTARDLVTGTAGTAKSTITQAGGLTKKGVSSLLGKVKSTIGESENTASQ